MLTFKRLLIVGGIILVVAMIAGCAAGTAKFEDQPAGFWAGLWHGFICLVTFVISLFTENVRMYEVNNTGGWYDFGFLLGACIFLGGGSSAHAKKKRSKSAEENEWEKIAQKVEEKVRKGIKNWAEESEEKDKDWEEIGRKIEEKIKRELSDWAER